ncbi:peptide deformylase [Candidatus Poribacteria bacterium]|nr:peptide deformylase [Candidatus Poribacteria bacterium]
MAELEIFKYGSDILRVKAKYIEEITEEIKQLAENMLSTMYSSDGVGLAAPQVGISKQIIVLDVDPYNPEAKPMALLNPKIIECEGEDDGEEGCLSVPDIRGIVRRYKNVVVEAMDLDGKKLRIEASDLMARALQHEIDHLNGILFVDHLSRLKLRLIKKQLNKIEEEAKAKQRAS